MRYQVVLALRYWRRLLSHVDARDGAVRFTLGYCLKPATLRAAVTVLSAHIRHERSVGGRRREGRGGAVADRVRV